MVRLISRINPGSTTFLKENVALSGQRQELVIRELELQAHNSSKKVRQMNESIAT